MSYSFLRLNCHGFAKKIAVDQMLKLVDQLSPEKHEEFISGIKLQQLKHEIQISLDQLDRGVNQPVTLEIVGSIALILTGYLSRATIDLDIVDEVPIAIRSRNKLLEELQKGYHLLLTHFQSHYLPSGWKERLQYLGQFGSLEVYTADVYDIFLGKLFSVRAKDLDDLRGIKPQLDKDKLKKQLRAACAVFLKKSTLKQAAEKNWYILFGENLPLS